MQLNIYWGLVLSALGTAVHAQSDGGMRNLNETQMSWSRSPRPALITEGTQAQPDQRPPAPAAHPTTLPVTGQTPWPGRHEREILIPPPVKGQTAPATTVVPMATPAYTPPVAAESAPTTAQRWSLSLRDRTLHRALLRWASEARYQMIWQTDRDFPIESEVEFQGDFQAAVGQVMAGVAQTDHPLQAVFNHSTRTMRVLRFMDERDPSR